MQEKKTHPWVNILIALAILVAIGAAGYFYTTRERSAADLLVESSSNTASVDGDLLSALGKLRTITLDESVFNNLVFKSLSDFSTTLAPQPSGRQNPFAPLPLAAQSISTGAPAITQ